MRRIGLVAAIVTACGNLGPDGHLTLVEGDAQTGLAGEPVRSALVVRVTDGDKPLGGTIVEFRVTAGGGIIANSPPPPPGEATTRVRAASDMDGTLVTDTSDATGAAESYWWLGPSTDSQRVEARLKGPGTQAAAVFRATSTPGGVRRIEPVAGEAQSGRVGEVLRDSLVVRAVDVFGTRIPNVWLIWSARHPAVGINVFYTGRGESKLGGTLSPDTAFTDAAGLARFRWTLGQTPGVDTSYVSTRACFCGRSYIDVTEGWATATVLPE